MADSLPDVPRPRVKQKILLGGQLPVALSSSSFLSEVHEGTPEHTYENTDLDVVSSHDEVDQKLASKEVKEENEQKMNQNNKENNSPRKKKEKKLKKEKKEEN